MVNKVSHIRAARALLNWSQKDLAERSGVSDVSIINYETEKRIPHQTTIDKIVRAFELAGVVFTKNGVEHSDNTITVIEGEGWYVRLLEDVYQSLKGSPNSEVLLICGDDKLSPTDVNDCWRKIRSAGVQVRQLVEDGNVYLMGPLKEYRYMPKERFKNYVSLIYADKVAICTDANTKALIFKDPILAQTWTNLFDVMWDVLKQPEKSEAHERF